MSRASTRRRAAYGAATLAAFAVAGCGGEAAPSPTTPVPVSASSDAPSLTAEETEAQAAALQAYDSFREAHVVASADTEADDTELVKYTADPLTSELRYDLLVKSQQGIVTTGEPTWKATVTAVNVGERPFSVKIEDCFDATNWKTVFESSGEEAAVPGQAKKYLVEAEVIQYDDGRWLVRSAKADRERPC